MASLQQSQGRGWRSKPLPTFLVCMMSNSCTKWRNDYCPCSAACLKFGMWTNARVWLVCSTAKVLVGARLWSRPVSMIHPPVPSLVPCKPLMLMTSLELQGQIGMGKQWFMPIDQVTLLIKLLIFIWLACAFVKCCFHFWFTLPIFWTNRKTCLGNMPLNLKMVLKFQ